MAASTVLSANRDVLGKKADSKHSGEYALSERSAQPPIKCPECHSSKVWKDGLRYVRSEIGTIAVQRYVCRDCGRRFSEDISYLQPNRRGYNRTSGHSRRQVCVALAEGSKNLVRAESRIEKRAAGATPKPGQADVKGKIIEHAWWLKKQGYAETTIVNRSGVLKRLVKYGANLFDPETVKDVIAQRDCSEGTKLQMVAAYTTFAIMMGLKWEPPGYRQTDKIPFIPTEQEIDQLIAGCGKKTATVLQTLKETGMRIGEAWRLQWTDLDLERNLIRVNMPEKRSNPRILKISKNLVAMLNRLPKHNTRIFGNTCSRSAASTFRVQRKRIATKLQNLRILQITFHTLRHWKATTEYHRTRDILYVKTVLGHKRIDNTLIYIQLEKTIFQSQNDEWTVKVAKSVDEACQLVEVGFEYVTGEYVDGGKIFRKRK